MRLAFLAVVLLVAACAGGTKHAAPPPKPPPPLAARCGEAGLHAETFWFRSSDDVLLDGAIAGRGSTGVVLATQSDVDLCSWARYARVLVRRGFRVLLFDFRGLGLSHNPRRVDAQGNVVADVVAAAGELRRRGAGRVYLVGASLGAVASLSAATRIDPPVAGVASLSGESDLSGLLDAPSMNALAAMPRLRVPLLVLVVREDQYVTVAESRALVRTAASPSKAIAVFPGSWHGWDLLYTAPYRRRASSLLLKFLAG